jgi:hypothetical protein
MAKRTRKPDQEVADDLTNLEERMAKVARRSPLSLWVLRNFDQLSALIDEYGPHWGEMAKWMNEQGAIASQSVTGDSLRKAFNRELENKRERENKRKRDQSDDPAKPKTPPKVQPAAGPPPVRLLDEGRPAEPKPAFDKDEFLKGMKRPWER